jgi:hypothetical protein
MFPFTTVMMDGIVRSLFRPLSASEFGMTTRRSGRVPRHSQAHRAAPPAIPESAP